MLAPISMSDASMLSAENRPASGWPTPEAVTLAIFMLHRRLRGRFSRNIGDPERAAPQVERHLAVACLAAARANLLERGLDLARDPVLRVKLEAEEAAHRDHDHGGQAHQYLYH